MYIIHDSRSTSVSNYIINRDFITHSDIVTSIKRKLFVVADSARTMHRAVIACFHKIVISRQNVCLVAYIFVIFCISCIW